MTIKEIFYSLQGEGINSGRAAIFVRLSRCNLRCSYCDTDFEGGEELSHEEIAERIAQYPTRFMIWTGGEPTLQLDDKTIAYFHNLGYEQAIETNGTRPTPKGLDYITCSPKPEAMKLLGSNFPMGVSEFRFPITPEGALPPAIEELPPAKAYLVSPVFSGQAQMELDPKALARCIDFVRQDPRWRLSLQLHKLIGIE